MALLYIDHVPMTVKMNLPLTVIVPEPAALRAQPLRERKVLYLLHGLSDDASAWLRYSTIESVAMARGLVVVMPSVGRSFYVDQPNGQLYFSYLTDELPRYLSDVFGLSTRREDTLIAGVSMGGYGAFKTAFAFPERFAAAASLSGVLSLEVFNALPGDPRQAEFAHIFGDLSKLGGSAHDPAAWVADAAKRGVSLPKLYVTCGRQDDLYPLHRHFLALCQAQGLTVDAHDEDGGHVWPFWDRQIQRFLDHVL
ncbi:MAG TPA: alpha/beta hydrolase family protein [Anaerolineales bacterium]|nr:alpha/beta hydrolase family protein [Anaerolineales bacterium]